MHKEKVVVVVDMDIDDEAAGVQNQFGYYEHHGKGFVDEKGLTMEIQGCFGSEG